MNVSSKSLLHALLIDGVKPSEIINIIKYNKYDKYNIDKALKRIVPKKTQNTSVSGYKNGGRYCTFKKIIRYIETNNIVILNVFDTEYPFILKEIAYPPLLLFTRGKKLEAKRPGIAVVGTRRFTHYGKDAAIYIAGQLSKAGITVISGMATGVDYFAHKAALQEKGGSIGVLGCGIDVLYPHENKDLYNEIIENGSMVTEYLPGTPPLKQNFPARNRIISGLSMGVVVVEAGEKSGALITGNFALEQNREVFSVPGSIFSYESRGCHKLIKSGAKLVENIDDILEEIKQYSDMYQIAKRVRGPDKILHEKSSQLSMEQKLVYDFIGYKPKTIEEIIINSNLSTGKVLQIITELQFADLIMQKNLNEFIRI